MMMTVASQALLLSAAAASPIAFGACLGDYSLSGEYHRSDAVLTGLVTDAHLIEDKSDPVAFLGIVYSVRVDRSYRGGLRGVVRVYSENSSGRFPMELGRRYVLFLHKSGPNLAAYDYSNSGPVEDKAAVLRSLTSQTP
jgi:hypothetical protein